MTDVRTRPVVVARIGSLTVGWLVLFALTPGVLVSGVGSLVTADHATQLLIESGVAALVSAVLLVVFRRRARQVFGRGRPAWAYLLPGALLVILPLHYGALIADPLPIGVYIAWMACSVFYQDYLTFGLLQDQLGRWLRPGAVIAIVAVLFPLGHAVLIPERFANPIGVLSMAALGALFAVSRRRLGSLHPILALHFAFYLLVV